MCIYCIMYDNKKEIHKHNVIEAVHTFVLCLKVSPGKVNYKGLKRLLLHLVHVKYVWFPQI